MAAISDCSQWNNIVQTLGSSSSALQCCSTNSASYMTCSGTSTILTLNLSSFQLTGSLSPLFGSLTSLTSLDLASNSLTGSIPTEMGSMTSLTYLDLSRNQLSGAIPSSLSQTQLANLFLQNNKFSGTLPQAIRNMPTFRHVIADASVLNGVSNSTSSTTSAPRSTSTPPVSTTSSISTPTQTAVPSSNSTVATGTSSTGVIVGVSVAFILGCIVFGSLAWKHYSNKKKRQSEFYYFEGMPGSTHTSRK